MLIFPAMPSPIVDYLSSCVTASRHGFRKLPPRVVGFVLEITVILYEVDTNKEWRKCQRRSNQASAPGIRRGRGFGNHLDRMGAALTQAKYLAKLFGHSSPAWAVVWTDDLCRIFYRPDQVHVSELTDWARQVNFEVTSREGGVQVCAPLWHEFFHIGDIPTRKEVLSLSYVKEELEFNAGDDDDPEYEGAGGAIPAAPAVIIEEVLAAACNETLGPPGNRTPQ